MMAKKKNMDYSSLQDIGFQQAAAAASTAPTTISLSQLQADIEKSVTEAEKAISESNALAEQSAKDAEILAEEDSRAVNFLNTVTSSIPPLNNVTYTASDGTVFVDQASRDRYEQSLSNKERAGKSAFALLESEFARYGMQSLIEPLRKFIKQGLSQDELIIELRKDPNYQLRFSGNEERIKKGLRALSEAEYIGLEDAYQDIMQRYGLPESYYKKGDLGRQAGFEQLIGFDVSPLQLEERVMLAQNRVKNAPPEVLASLKEFYPDINNGEILAYTLDPKNAIENIKRKVLASEIGAGARQAGLGLGRERAEEFGAFGITGEQSRAGFQQIAGGLERGSQLAAIYQQQPYKQETAETEIFGLAGAPEARKRRQKIIKSEEATFGGQTGLTGGALSRDRAGQY
jgi:hypothetical protein